jgi:putative membrane-bound dehydrogenase-like protein
VKWSFPTVLASFSLCLALTASPAQTPQPPIVPPAPPLPKPDGIGPLIDQGEHDARLKGYLAPEGVKVEIAADFPSVVNPVGLVFGPDGVLYVAEWVAPANGKVQETNIEFTDKEGTTRKVAVLKKSVKDRIKILLDAKGKGSYDEGKVVLEEEFPSGLLIHDGYLYISGQGTVRRYQQEKTGGSFGKKEVIARGFGGLGHQQVSGLAIGQDGWLYISTGAGDHFALGSDGSRADVLRTGAVFRCKPDGSKLHVFALGFYNPYGAVAFDPVGNVFHADSDPGGGAKFAGGRLLHVAEDADFGWRSLPGTHSHQPDPLRAALYGERPGTLKPMLATGPGAASGLLIYNDTFFPEEYRGVLYAPDMARQCVRGYRVEPEGATFAVSHQFDLLKSDDHLFRPCQVVLGPDGAMYVCDRRTDAKGLEKYWGDGKHGRIYRLSWAGTKDKPANKLRGLDAWAQIAKQSDEDLFKTLDSDNCSDRVRAQQEIAHRGTKHRKQLLKLVEGEGLPVFARIAALGAVQSIWNEDVGKEVQKLVGHPDADLHRLAVNALALNAPKGDNSIHQSLVEALSVTDPAVKRALVLALGKIGADGAGDTLANMLKFDNGKDPYLHDGILRGIEHQGKPGLDALLSLANSGVEKDLTLVVKSFTALRSAAAADALPDLLKNVHLTSKDKVALVESFQNYQFDPPLALDPVVHYLEDLVELSKTMPVTKELKAKIEAARPVKVACLKVLAAAHSLKVPNTQQLVLAVLAIPDRGLQKDAIAAVGTDSVGAKLVGQQYLDKKLPSDLAPQVTEVLTPHAKHDPALAQLLADVTKAAPPKE